MSTIPWGLFRQETRLMRLLWWLVMPNTEIYCLLHLYRCVGQISQCLPTIKRFTTDMLLLKPILPSLGFKEVD